MEGGRRKEWRVVSEQSIRASINQDLERSKLGDSDERTICEVQHGQEGVEFIQMGDNVGVDDGIIQQRIHSLAMQREGLMQMEIELSAQMIAKSEVLALQSSFDTRLNEQSVITAKLQDQVREREERIHDLKRKMEEKERELHAVRLVNEAAWAKEDLLREQNKELANFRRERDSSEAQRAHHIKQIHELQECFQDKERQFLELQEQLRVVQETIHYKDEQIRDAQGWIARVQEIDVLQSSTLQAELRERTEQYNQLWLGCQRQCAEMERLHMQTIQQLELELAGVRGKSRISNTESSITQNSSDGSQVVPNSGSCDEVNGGGMPNSSSESLLNGNPENSLAFVSSGDAHKQTNHAPSLLISPPSILGMPPGLPTGQVPALHSYVMHQQGANHSMGSHVPHTHVGHFHSVPAMASFNQWQNHQALSENPPVSFQSQYSPSQNEENSSKSLSNHGYELSVNVPGLHSNYLNARMSEGLNPNSQMSPTVETRKLESLQRDYLVDNEAEHSVQQISSHFHEALQLEPRNPSSATKDNDVINITDSGSECQGVKAEQMSYTASLPSKKSIHLEHSGEVVVDTPATAELSEKNVSTGQTNSSLNVKITDSALLDERALLACIVRTIPPGGKIRISSTLPNRLGKMLAPLHWHDYRKKYGKLDEFVSSHPELFVIEEDFIQLRDGAHGIIAATAAVAKVAAAVASSSPYSSLFPSVAVTPMANTGRPKHPGGSGFGYSNVKISSKSQDYLEPNNSEIRLSQALMAPAENGVHSGRTGYLLNQGSVWTTRTSAGFVAKQLGRSSSQFPSSR